MITKKASVRQSYSLRKLCIWANAHVDRKNTSPFAALLQLWRCYERDVDHQTIGTTRVGDVGPRWISQSKKREDYFNRNVKTGAKASSMSPSVIEAMQPPRDPDSNPKYYYDVDKEADHSSTKSSYSVSAEQYINSEQNINTESKKPERQFEFNASVLDGFDGRKVDDIETINSEASIKRLAKSQFQTKNEKMQMKYGLKKYVKRYGVVANSFMKINKDRRSIKAAEMRRPSLDLKSNQEQECVLFSRNSIEQEDLHSCKLAAKLNNKLKRVASLKDTCGSQERVSEMDQSNFTAIVNRWKSFEQEMREQKALKEGPLRWSTKNANDHPENKSRTFYDEIVESPPQSVNLDSKAYLSAEAKRDASTESNDLASSTLIPGREGKEPKEGSDLQMSATAPTLTEMMGESNSTNTLESPLTLPDMFKPTLFQSEVEATKNSDSSPNVESDKTINRKKDGLIRVSGAQKHHLTLKKSEFKGNPKQRKKHFEILRKRMRLWESKRAGSRRIEKMSQVKPFSLNSNLMESLYQSNVSQYNEMKDINEFVYPSFKTDSEIDELPGINNLETNQGAQMNPEFAWSSPEDINNSHPSVSINCEGINSFVNFQDNHSTEEMFVCELFSNDNSKNETKPESSAYPVLAESYFKSGSTTSTAKTSECINRGNSFCSSAWKKVTPVGVGDNSGVRYSTEPYFNEAIDTAKFDVQSFGMVMGYPETYFPKNRTSPEDNEKVFSLLKPTQMKDLTNLFTLNMDEKCSVWPSFQKAAVREQDHKRPDCVSDKNVSSVIEYQLPQKQPSRIKSKLRKLFCLPNPKCRRANSSDSYGFVGDTKKVNNTQPKQFLPFSNSDAPRTEVFRMPVRWISRLSNSEAGTLKNRDHPTEFVTAARDTLLFSSTSAFLSKQSYHVGPSRQRSLLSNIKFTTEGGVRNFSTKPSAIFAGCFQISVGRTIVTDAYESQEQTATEAYNPASRAAWTKGSRYGLQNIDSNLDAPDLFKTPDLFRCPEEITFNIAKDRNDILNHLRCRQNYNAVDNENSPSEPEPNSKSSVELPLVLETSNKLSNALHYLTSKKMSTSAVSLTPSDGAEIETKADESGSSTPGPPVLPAITDSLDLKLMDLKKRTQSRNGSLTFSTHSKSQAKVAQNNSKVARFNSHRLRNPPTPDKPIFAEAKLNKTNRQHLSGEMKAKLNKINRQHLGDIDLKLNFFKKDERESTKILYDKIFKRPRKGCYSGFELVYPPNKFQGIHPEAIKRASTPIRPYKPPDDTIRPMWFTAQFNNKNKPKDRRIDKINK